MTPGCSCLCWKFFLLAFLSFQVVQSGGPPKELNFNCDGTGKINTITQVGTNESQILIRISDNNFCHYSEQKCKTDHEASSLYVIVQEDINPKLFAGKTHLHYILECKNEYDISASAFPFNVSPSSTMEPITVTKAPPVLSLQILRTQLPIAENAAVYIGEPLQLEISSTGNTVYPQSCTAYNGEDDTIHVPLWTFKQPKTDTICSDFDPAITVQKWKLKQSNKQTLDLSISAFQFTTSSKVVIKCRALVCTSSCSPVESKTCVDTSTRRRKRQSQKYVTTANQKEKTEEAYVSFSVDYENRMPNKSNAVSASLSLVFAFVVFGRRMVAFLRED